MVSAAKMWEELVKLVVPVSRAASLNHKGAT